MADHMRTIPPILVSVSLNALAQILLRLGARTSAAAEAQTGLMHFAGLIFQPAFLGGLACYAISLLVWTYVLSRVEVSFAYPFLGLGFVAVTFASALFLGESLSLARLGGTLLVGIGVVLIAQS